MLSSLGVSEHTCKARFRVFELRFSSILSDETLSSVEQARVILIPWVHRSEMLVGQLIFLSSLCMCHNRLFIIRLLVYIH